jgi:hypothetical protein
MYGRTDVRNESSLKWKYVKNVSMYECHGWTDKFQLFQFSFSSVAYSQVESVRPYGRSGQKKNVTNTTHTQIRSEVILNVTDGTIQNNAVLLTLRSVSMQCNAMQYNAMQYNAMQYSIAVMQCNAIQCNAMQCNVCTESVRPYGMKSVSHFFFFFFIF